MELEVAILFELPVAIIDGWPILAVEVAVLFSSLAFDVQPELLVLAHYLSILLFLLSNNLRHRS